MEQFDRFEKLDDALASFNREATAAPGVPVLRVRDYMHYCDVRDFTYAYAWRLRLPAQAYAALLRFCYRDTLALRNRVTPFDPYLVTWRYFQYFSYRTGNLDTPDDCEEKLDWERFAQYRAAREKQWRGEALSIQETTLLQALTDALAAGLLRQAQTAWRAQPAPEKNA